MYGQCLCGPTGDLPFESYSEYGISFPSIYIDEQLGLN